MSVIAPPPPATAAARPLPRPTSPAAHRRRALLLGLALVVALLAGAGVVFESFGGAFSSYVVVRAELPANATAVALGAPVEYRNVTVGSVASQGEAAPGGLVVLTLHLQPGTLASIPAGVEATEAPQSVFGDPYVVLEPPPQAAGAALRAGATIPPLTRGATASLQATLGDLDALLVELHPAELDAALTALAGALQGEGTSLGRNLDEANAYLVQMLPLWPKVVADLHTLVPVADTFAAGSQDILSILAAQTTTAATIDGDAANVRAAIGGGATLADDAAALLQGIRQPYAVLAADAGAFLQAAAQSPSEIPRLLAGLDAWATAWTAAESSGPYLDLSTDVVVANPADLGLAVIGGPDVTADLAGGLGSGAVNPATYSSAGTITTAAILSALAAAPAPPLAEPAEARSVAQIAAALDGGRAPADAAVSTLLLGPLLTSLVRAP